MLIVAIHDVSPPELSEVRWLLGHLDAFGVQRRVLKVVPADPEAPATDELVSLLHEQAAAGSEVVLHGWTHRAEGPPRGSLPDRLRARLFAGGAAEFLGLDDAEVVRRVTAGRDWLQGARLPVGGFCPPAWLATAALVPALRSVGFRYVVTLRGIRSMQSRRWLTLPPWGYMGADAIQEQMVRVGAAVLSRPLARTLRIPAERVFVHPHRASRSRDCARVLREIERLARTHRSITYGDLLGA